MPSPLPSSSYPGFPSLSSDQQKLLLAALTSNDRSRSLNMDEFLQNSDNGPQSSTDADTLRAQSESIDPSVFGAGPGSMSSQPTFGDGLLPDPVNGPSDFDVDVDLGQNDYDEDGFGNFDPVFDGEYGEKRKSPDDDDDDDEEEGDSKRREGEDKGPKKPGRKPLTSEPTTKRKAQNRAAQRAFRERKEKHLKDLEIKVSSLEHASKSTNHENELLKARIIKLQTELTDYRKRLSLAGNALNGSPPATDSSNYQSKSTSSTGSFDFQFDFPPFGDLFGSNAASNSPTSVTNNDFSLVKAEPASRANSTSASPLRNGDYSMGSPSINGSYAGRGSQSNGPSAGVFTPGLFNLSDANYGFPTFGSPNTLQQSVSPPAQNGARSDSTQPQSISDSVTSNAASPSSSTISHNGGASSAGTSPEPTNGYTNGDKFKQNAASNVLNSPQDPKAQQPTTDLSSFQFDPALFGGYRETQDAIFGDGDFTGGLYDDYLNLPDFDANSFSYNNNGMRNTPRAQSTPGPTLMEQLDKHQDECQEDTVVHTSNKMEEQNMMTCHKIWEEISTCPKFIEGDLDIDGLCSELSKKATCSETGAVIPKAEWEAALWRLVGQDQPKDAAKLTTAVAAK